MEPVETPIKPTVAEVLKDFDNLSSSQKSKFYCLGSFVVYEHDIDLIGRDCLNDGKKYYTTTAGEVTSTDAYSVYKFDEKD